MNEDTTVEVKFTETDVYVIVTPLGEEVHVTKDQALAIQYALFTTDVPKQWDLLRWLDEHALRPFLDRTRRQPRNWREGMTELFSPPGAIGRQHRGADVETSTDQ